MILKELCDYYDLLASDAKSGISLMGYSAVSCSAAIVITKNGQFKGLITLSEGKSKSIFVVPEQKGRSGKNPPPYFLCDNAKYLLGFEYSKETKTLVPTTERVKSSYEFHAKLAEESKDEALLAVVKFLKERAEGVKLSISPDDAVFQNGNLVFRLDSGEYVHDLSSVKEYWEKYSAAQVSEVIGQCLITGENKKPISKTHTMLKGIYDGNKTGCSLVGFNQSSFTSYGRKQSYNAPVSESAMFKYTTALNYLLQDSDSKIRMGDTTVVFWAKSNGSERKILSQLLSGYSVNAADVCATHTNIEIMDILKNIREGKPVSGIANPNVKTYVLGLAPNMARVSVRFWYESTFIDFIGKISRFQDEIAIKKYEKFPKYVSISTILRSISADQKSKDWWKKVPSTFENGLFKAVVSGCQYPMAIYSTVLMRIRAETGDEYGIDSVRAGFLKAVLMRNFHKEELTVSLNEKSNDTAYNLGRLFAVMEALQLKANANGKENEKMNGMANIRSKYFASASVNPKLVYPSLLSLAQHHIAKLDKTGFYYDKQMESILSKINDFPANLSLEKQGMFVLGYYHQREQNYTKKVDTENQEN